MHVGHVYIHQQNYSQEVKGVVSSHSLALLWLYSCVMCVTQMTSCTILWHSCYKSYTIPKEKHSQLQQKVNL